MPLVQVARAQSGRSFDEHSHADSACAAVVGAHGAERAGAGHGAPNVSDADATYRPEIVIFPPRSTRAAPFHRRPFKAFIGDPRGPLASTGLRLGSPLRRHRQSATANANFPPGLRITHPASGGKWPRHTWVGLHASSLPARIVAIGIKTRVFGVTSSKLLTAMCTCILILTNTCVKLLSQHLLAAYRDTPPEKRHPALMWAASGSTLV